MLKIRISTRIKNFSETLSKVGFSILDVRIYSNKVKWNLFIYAKYENTSHEAFKKRPKETLKRILNQINHSRTIHDKPDQCTSFGQWAYSERTSQILKYQRVVNFRINYLRNCHSTVFIMTFIRPVLVLVFGQWLPVLSWSR